MIAERCVLLRIEHFHQRRRRIAAEIAAELVHLVQHQHRVHRFRTANSLNDLAGQSADVRAPVAADFRFVVHAAERHANELASQRPRDRFSKRSLSHAWRSDEAKDRSLHSRLQFLHRQIIQNALLHFFQVVVILVQNRLRIGDVDFRRCRRLCSTAARSSIPGTCAPPCTRRKPESSSQAASVRGRIPSSPRRTCRTLPPSCAALPLRLRRRRIRPAPSESPSSVRAAEIHAGSGSPAPAPVRESCCAVRALPFLWKVR